MAAAAAPPHLFRPPRRTSSHGSHQPPPSHNLLRELFRNTTASQLTPPSLPQLTSPATKARVPPPSTAATNLQNFARTNSHAPATTMATTETRLKRISRSITIAQHHLLASTADLQPRRPTTASHQRLHLHLRELVPSPPVTVALHPYTISAPDRRRRARRSIVVGEEEEASRHCR